MASLASLFPTVVIASDCSGILAPVVDEATAHVSACIYMSIIWARLRKRGGEFSPQLAS